MNVSCSNHKLILRSQLQQPYVIEGFSLRTLFPSCNKKIYFLLTSPKKQNYAAGSKEGEEIKMVIIAELGMAQKSPRGSALRKKLPVNICTSVNTTKDSLGTN